ncbi:MAG: OmpH family outer membrane protein [Gammaproteobacteria bacterium]|nr:OmpH family outer membrane protein [Gammaproteobacteria bacterium]
MSKLIKGLVVAVALGLASTVMAADIGPIAIVNINQVFEKAPQGQAAFTQYQNKMAPNVTKLQDQQKALNQKIADYQANKAKLSAAEQSAQESQLLVQQQMLQSSVATMQQSAQLEEKGMLNAFSAKMNTQVAEIAKQKGYHLVLNSQGALYSDKTVANVTQDITPEVISSMQNS